MSTKVDETSAVDTHIVNMSATTTASTVSPGGPKVCKFAVKSGFVIPKNKLLGSLVPVFRGEEERALAYQICWEFLTNLGGSNYTVGIVEVEDYEGSRLATRGADNKSYDSQVDSETLELFELEKREAIGEILKLNPCYKTPPYYKPLLKRLK